ncbi:myocyte-specific enhancer factor 2D homolog isoform X2 [Oncorhynchus mykiss]|uniref:myocyte-specific enhancer factor 2D homolog isoform X2 n=1 Tax=Oncorhynchus mykiss TaxID=8022 RepID=UPI0018788E2E|nr:myocyte-specific enhancer factor 2D homolog isoform X2 [Oncorhynchus mykiss]
MGRKKIQIQRITDERNRQVTFTKRKFGLMKKAYELSVLCDCEIALIIFNHSNKLFQYASTDMDKVLLKYTEYNEPHESRTNADIIETLRKKGFSGCESPEPDGEDSIDQSPLNDDKYRKTTEDLDILFKRYGVSSSVPPPTFSVPVTVQASTQNALQFSNPGNAMVTTSYVTSSSLSDNHHLSPQPPALQRSTGSPGLPQRPASAGAMLGGDLNNSNGGCPSPVPNGYISARASPGLLSVSNGNSLGKVVPAKSPPPPQSPQMVNSRKPDIRVITTQGGKSLMQMTDDELEMNAQRLAGAQVTQMLTTPVVSVTTPSLLAQGMPFSAMPTAYNTEYQLTSADITALHALASPGGLLQGNAPWQQSLSQQQHQQQQQLSLASLSNLVMWGMDKQSGELSSQISSLAANLSASQSNLLLGRDEWLGRYCICPYCVMSVRFWLPRHVISVMVVSTFFLNGCKVTKFWKLYHSSQVFQKFWNPPSGISEKSSFWMIIFDSCHDPFAKSPAIHRQFHAFFNAVACFCMDFGSLKLNFACQLLGMDLIIDSNGVATTMPCWCSLCLKLHIRSLSLCLFCS